MQLPLLRGKERTFTLLHALVEQIFLHEPDLAKFSQELTEFEAVPDGERREGEKKKSTNKKMKSFNFCGNSYPHNMNDTY